MLTCVRSACARQTKFCLTGLPLFIRWQMPTLNIESLGATCINVATIVLVGENLPYRNRIDATLQQASQGVIGFAEPQQG